MPLKLICTIALLFVVTACQTNKAPTNFVASEATLAKVSERDIQDSGWVGSNQNGTEVRMRLTSVSAMYQSGGQQWITPDWEINDKGELVVVSKWSGGKRTDTFSIYDGEGGKLVLRGPSEGVVNGNPFSNTVVLKQVR